MSVSDKLPKQYDPWKTAPDGNAREAWRVFGIMSEFVEATERMKRVSANLERLQLFFWWSLPVQVTFYLELN